MNRQVSFMMVPGKAELWNIGKKVEPGHIRIFSHEGSLSAQIRVEIAESIDLFHGGKVDMKKTLR